MHAAVRIADSRATFRVDRGFYVGTIRVLIRDPCHYYYDYYYYYYYCYTIKLLYYYTIVLVVIFVFMSTGSFWSGSLGRWELIRFQLESLVGPLMGLPQGWEVVGASGSQDWPARLELVRRRIPTP